MTLIGALVRPFVYLVVGSAIAVPMALTNTRNREELILLIIGWIVTMPGSLVVFVLQMGIGSAIAGKVDFGVFRSSIPKAIVLLAPINFFFVPTICFLLPNIISSLKIFVAASFLSLVFWIWGLIFLFPLDVMEWGTWLKIVINWLLNIIANFISLLVYFVALIFVYQPKLT